MDIILYTTHCPQCIVLEKKLQQKNVSYTICEDVAEMRKLKLLSAPALSINGAKPMGFKESIDWVNSLEV